VCVSRFQTQGANRKPGIQWPAQFNLPLSEPLNEDRQLAQVLSRITGEVVLVPNLSGQCVMSRQHTW
jgi:hypothetical protein